MKISFTLLQATHPALLFLVPAGLSHRHYSFRGNDSLALSACHCHPPSGSVGFVISLETDGISERLLIDVQSSEPPLKILYSFKAIILAHTFYNFPIIMSLVSSYWEHLDANCEAASQTLGANKVQTFLKVTLPRLLPAIISAVSLVFLFCFNSFAIILVLGGGPQYTTMEVEIYRQARMLGNSGVAAAFSTSSPSSPLFLVSLATMLAREDCRMRTYQNSKRMIEKRPARCLQNWLALSTHSLVLSLWTIASVVILPVQSSRSAAEY